MGGGGADWGRGAGGGGGEARGFNQGGSSGRRGWGDEPWEYTKREARSDEDVDSIESIEDEEEEFEIRSSKKGRIR